MSSKDLFPSSWLINTLLDESFVANKKKELARQAIPYELGEWMASNFDAGTLAMSLFTTYRPFGFRHIGATPFSA